MHKGALAIGAFDSTGASGVSMDMRVFHNFRLYPAACVTAVIAQNTQTTFDYHPIPFTTIGEQLEAVLNDMAFNGIKLSHLPDATTVQLVGQILATKEIHPIVYDVTLFNSLGTRLGDDTIIESITSHLFPVVDILICNLKEASLLLGEPVEDVQTMRDAAEKLHEKGCKEVVITSSGTQARCMDVYYDGLNVKMVDAPKTVTENLLGHGSVFSACILGYLLKGEELHGALTKAKIYLRKAMSHAFKVGKGHHPLNLNTPL